MTHPTRRARWEDPEVRAAIEQAIDEELAWVAEGNPVGAQLEHEAREAVRQVLARYGLAGRVVLHRSPTGLRVEIALPASPPRVREVRLRLG
ncbi:MAG TPA: hypothetical protein PKA64_01795 [Myxococcota bacterium]|nr:hypothetical protein [Myxococcota bacterium]